MKMLSRSIQRSHLSGADQPTFLLNWQNHLTKFYINLHIFYEMTKMRAQLTLIINGRVKSRNRGERYVMYTHEFLLINGKHAVWNTKNEIWITKSYVLIHSRNQNNKTQRRHVNLCIFPSHSTLSVCSRSIRARMQRKREKQMIRMGETNEWEIS